MNRNDLTITLCLIFLLGLTQSCSKNQSKYTQDHKSVDKLELQHKVDYKIVLAEHMVTDDSDTRICNMTDFELNSQFEVIKKIKGELEINGPIIKVLNCNHYYEQPFVGRKYDGLTADYDFKWLLLLTKKHDGYFLVESELVFSLKDKGFAFCSLGNKIQSLLNLRNEYLGEKIGNPISLGIHERFYRNSECYSVIGDYAYLDHGVILE
ncbi:hypothetical protein [Marinicella rhabdoformis]|uniref:hypothetical protein n=1 Tax=Marinicella rhabdoformis TaxID=2580566 RepID=UPI0012AEC5B0|nr:hypothetical protein [Marinicella rhabdoformis]